MSKIESSAHSQIQRFVNGLRSKNDDTRWSTYRELRKYVSIELREASSEEVAAFVDDFYNQLKDLSSGDVNDRKAWILATRNLIAIDYAGKHQAAFSTAVRLLAQASPDTSMLELLAALVGQLALRAGTMTTDYVQSELSRCAEYLEQTESKRLFALFAYRQLAQATPTLFFQHVPAFFEGIFSTLRDPRAPVREQAAAALRAAFRVCSQREVTRKEKKERPRWYAQCFSEFERSFNDVITMQSQTGSATAGSSQQLALTSASQQKDAAKRMDKQKALEDYIHSELLIILELLRVANADAERTIYEMETAPNEFDVGSSTRTARGASGNAPIYDPFSAYDVDEGDAVVTASALTGSHTRSLVADLLRKSSISQAQRVPSGSSSQAAGELAALAPSGGFALAAAAAGEHDDNVPPGAAPSSAARFYESRTCAALWVDKFDTVCYRVLFEFRSSKQLASQLLILDTLPRLAALSPQKFVAMHRSESTAEKGQAAGAGSTSYLRESMAHLNTLLSSRGTPLGNAAFNCVGLIAYFVRDAIKQYLGSVLLTVKTTLQNATLAATTTTRRLGKGRLGATSAATTPTVANVQVEAEVFNCVRMLAIAVGEEEEFTKEAKDLLDKMMLAGLSPAFTASLHTLAKRVPLSEFRKEVQTALLKTLSLILTGTSRQPKASSATLAGTSKFGSAATGGGHGQSGGQGGVAGDIESADVRNVMLALKTLGNFDLDGFSLTHFVRHIADQYLAFDNKQIRLETALTCCKLLTPLLTSSQTQMHAGQSRSAVHTISEVLSRLITVAITDPEADIRRAVLLSLESRFDAFLAQSENLNALFVALNDENFEIRELALCTVGRLSAINPAQVLPFLRKALVQTVTDFEDSGSARNQEQAARLLGHLVYTCPVLVRSYMEQLVARLIPRLRNCETAAPASTAIMLTIGQLAIVSTDGLENWTRELLPVIIDMLQDSTSPQRREVAVWTLGQLVANTGAVAEPYRSHPQLLDILLNVFRVEQSLPMRKETIHVLGLLGALDPFRHRQLKGEFDRAGAEGDAEGRRRASPTTAVTAGRVGAPNTATTTVRYPTGTRHANAHAPLSDPGDTHAAVGSGGVGAAGSTVQAAGRQSEQETLIGLAASSLEDFYAMTAICAMMRVICDPSLHQHHVAAITACSQVFRSLGTKCDTYVHQVVPTYLSVLRSADADPTLREQLFKQLGIIIKLVRTQIRPYLEDVLAAMRDYWTVVPAQLNIIELLGQTAKALDYEVRPYLFMIMPNVLRVLVSPKASPASVDALLSVIQDMGAHLDDYLHILLPPITRLLDTASDSSSVPSEPSTPSSNQPTDAQIALKRHVLETIECLAQATDVGDYASLIVQALVRFLDRAPNTELRNRTAQTFCTLAMRLGSRFLLFVSVARKNFARHRIDAREFELLVQRLARTSAAMADGETDEEPLVATLNAVRRVAGTSQSDADTTQIRKYPFEAEKLRTACACDTSQMVSREDWTEWLRSLTFGVLRDSPSPALRACAAPAHAYQPLARQVFNAAFLSCWSELDETNVRDRDVRDAVVRALETALVASDSSSSDSVPEIVLTILNLAEFMEHTEKGALPLRANLLAEKAIRCRAYAKALHFKETEFREHLARLKEKPANGGDSASTASLPQGSAQLEALLESLITINNKLQQSEAAHGVLHYAVSRNIRVQPSWYEKLHSWQKALDAYDEQLTQLTVSNAGVNERDSLTNDQRETQLALQIGRLRCLDALAEWNTIDDMVSSNWSRSSDFQIKSARQAASAAWGRAEWQKFEKYTQLIPKETYDGLFYRAVNAVNARHFADAVMLIAKARDILDTELTAVVAESYSRAYAAMINVQMLSELEEVIEYKLVSERGPLLKQTWYERLSQCQSVVEDCQRFLQIRSLVITPQDDARTWLRFAALCRKNARWSLAYNTLHSLLAPTPLGAPAFISPSPTTPTSASMHHSPSAPVFGIPAPISIGVAGLHSPGGVFATAASSGNLASFGGVQNSAEAIRSAIYSHAATLTSSLPAQVVYQYAKCRWQEDTNSRKEAIAILQQLAAAFYTETRRLSSRNERNAVGAGAGVTAEFAACAMFAPNGERLSPRNAQHLLAKVFLHLGLWHDSLDSSNERNLTNVLNYFAAATERDPSWYKAWHLLALTNYEALLEAAASAGTLQTTGAPQNGAASTGAAAGGGDTLGRLGTSTSSETSIGANASGDQPNASGDSQVPLHSAEGSRDYVVTMRKYCVTAIRGFVRSISLSRRNALQDILRLVTLWFDFGSFHEAFEALKEGIGAIEIEHWLQVIPQIIARIDTQKPYVATLVTQLLCEIGKHHPQALIYPLTVASKGNAGQRQIAASRILQSLCEHSNMLVQQALLISEELIRVAILWHELWHERLEEASRLYFGEHNADAMITVLTPLHELVVRGWQTMKEHSFTVQYARELSEAFEWCKKYERTRNPKDIGQAWELYYQVFKRISKQLPQLNALELTSVSPKLLRVHDYELAVPGTYSPGRPVVRIKGVKPNLQVISSKQRPRKLSIYGSDGHEYQFLLKGHEDLRQDERVMQLFGLVNSLLLENAETNRRNLTIRRMAVVPLSTNSGLIGWLHNCDTLHSLIRDYREKKKILLNIEHRLMLKLAPDYEHLTLLQKVEIFGQALENTDGDDLQRILWYKSPNSETWFERRCTYTRSLAVMSMVGYVLGLGDRHPSNLMLDRLSGKVVHIDFGDCFEVAMHREKFPERIPFRLTRMLVNAMEITGIEGNYRMTCEAVMNVLRQHKDSVMAVLEAFIYDPLLNWRLVEPATGNARRNAQAPDFAAPIGGTEDEPTERARREVTEEQPIAANDQRVHGVINRVRDKLTGRDFDRQRKVDVPTQVACLIRQATAHENLCQCYIGWCPFW